MRFSTTNCSFIKPWVYRNDQQVLAKHHVIESFRTYYGIKAVSLLIVEEQQEQQHSTNLHHFYDITRVVYDPRTPIAHKLCGLAEPRSDVRDIDNLHFWSMVASTGTYVSILFLHDMKFQFVFSKTEYRALEEDQWKYEFEVVAFCGLCDGYAFVVTQVDPMALFHMLHCNFSQVCLASIQRLSAFRALE